MPIKYLHLVRKAAYDATGSAWWIDVKHADGRIDPLAADSDGELLAKVEALLKANEQPNPAKP